MRINIDTTSYLTSGSSGLFLYVSVSISLSLFDLYIRKRNLQYAVLMYVLQLIQEAMQQEEGQGRNLAF